MTTTAQPTTTCPTWCEVDHEEQARELAATARFPDDLMPFHSRVLVEGVDTESHGPVYSVAIENSHGKTRLYVALEAATITADQAEAFGLGLVRAAYLLRASTDAVTTTQLESYWNGESYVRVGALDLEPTAVERALSAVRSEEEK